MEKENESWEENQIVILSLASTDLHLLLVRHQPPNESETEWSFYSFQIHIYIDIYLLEAVLLQDCLWSDIYTDTNVGKYKCPPWMCALQCWALFDIFVILIFFIICLSHFDWGVGCFNRPGPELGYFYGHFGLEVTIWPLSKTPNCPNSNIAHLA